MNDFRCFVKDDGEAFGVTIDGNKDVVALKKLIWEECKNTVLKNVDAKDLVLLRVNIPRASKAFLAKLEIKEGDAHTLRLENLELISSYWPEQPPFGFLHIFVIPPAPFQKQVSDELAPNVLSSQSSFLGKKRGIELGSGPDDQRNAGSTGPKRARANHLLKALDSDLSVIHELFWGKKNPREFEESTINIWTPPNEDDGGTVDDADNGGTVDDEDIGGTVDDEDNGAVDDDYGGTVDDDGEATTSPGEFTTYRFIHLPAGTQFPSQRTKLLVTATYDQFLEILEKHSADWNQFESNIQDEEVPPSNATIIFGQPGIGKSMFLDYFLVRRLQKELVTIYCNDKEYWYVFTATGVRRVPIGDTPELQDVDCTVLVNICPNLGEPPIELHYTYRRTARVVIATSPNEDHVAAFLKESVAYKVCMPTWGWNDIYCLGHMRRDWYQVDDQTFNKNLYEAFSKFGGIPRLSFYAFNSGLCEQREVAIENAIKNGPFWEELIGALKADMPFTSKTSNKVIRIEPMGNDFIKTYYDFVSNYVAEIVFDWLETSMTKRFHTRISELLELPSARGYAGKLFELAIHKKFLSGHTFQPSPLSTNAPHFTIDISECNKTADNYFHNLNVRATRHSRKVHKDKIRQYLIPASLIQESVDSLWISDKITVLFQITVAPSHSVKQRGLSVIVNQLPASAKKDIRIVFVVPKGDNRLKMPQQIVGDDCAIGKAYPQYVYEFDIGHNYPSN